ncbi:MAG: MFS transporter, partial [Armatimonadetes bacterium]|nr:MFS transporter [Armatimonadota bacterium]
DRAGKGIRTPPRDAMLADAVVAAQWGKAYGLHRAMDTGGAIAGTALALLLFRYTGSYQQTFAWAALAGAGAVLVLAALVAEPAAAGGARRQSPPVLRGYPAGFWVFVASYAIFSAANVTYAFFLLRAQDLGVPPTWVPAVYLLHNVVYAAAGLPIGALSDRFSAWKSTVSIYLLHAAVCIGLSFASTAWASVVAVAIYGVVLAGLGAATRALAAELIPSPLRASGMAIYRGVGGIAALPGSWAIGLLWDRFGPVTAWTCAAALAGVGAAVLLTLPRSRVHSAA